MENPDRSSDTYAPISVPADGDLRFVEREILSGEGEYEPVTKRKVRILQRYEWSYTLSDFGWFDVPIGAEEKEKKN